MTHLDYRDKLLGSHDSHRSYALMDTIEVDAMDCQKVRDSQKVQQLSSSQKKD